MKQIIIGLGFRAQCGKDTAANVMAEVTDGWTRRFAQPIRDIARMFVTCGNLQQTWDYEAFKTEVNFTGKTGGAILQELGSTLKGVFGEDVFVRYLLKSFSDQQSPIFIPDLRFKIEADAIRKAGGLCINIIRPACEMELPQHVSESEGYEINWDLILYNNGTLIEFESVCDLLGRCIIQLEHSAIARGLDFRTHAVETLTPLLSQAPRLVGETPRIADVVSSLRKYLDSCR